MKNPFKRLNPDFQATAAGIIVAVCTAWMTIEWKEFDIQKEWPKLALSGVIAAGGVLSKMKTPK